jgi:hypothetical protein
VRIIANGEEIPIEEACAMTTRVSPSFIRVGHFDLFGRLVVVVVNVMTTIMPFISLSCRFCIRKISARYQPRCHPCLRRARQARNAEDKARAMDELRLM